MHRRLLITGNAYDKIVSLSGFESGIQTHALPSYSTGMNNNQNPTVFAVQAAIENLLELIERAGRGFASEEIGQLGEEAQKTVLMLIAAIVLSDQKYKPGEQAFLRLLVDLRDKPGGEIRCLNEYAAEWGEASMKVPHFFEVAVRHDTRHETDIARAMLREIQLIGNNACISDGSFESVEHETVKGYLAFLEEFILTWNVQAKNKCQPLGGWLSVNG
jgi:hypothetical protein